MEIEGTDGSKTRVEPGLTIQFGRGHGFNSTNRKVSRRHVTLQMEDHKDKSTVRFEVIGLNPIWVHNRKTEKVEIFRRFDHGEMENGDIFCLSAENPIWFALKGVEFEDENDQNEKRALALRNELAAESIELSRDVEERDEELDVRSVDISNIDPIKEFGLVVIGHEFDGYPKKMIQDARSWEWYIEEHEEESEDDHGVEGRKEKKRRKKKKKKDEENDDEEWTGESEEEILLSKPRKVQKPLYSTRSRDCNRTDKDRRNANPSGQKKYKLADEDHEDDETLGGFIVDDVQDDECEMDEDDEEEDFIEDEDEE